MAERTTLAAVAAEVAAIRAELAERESRRREVEQQVREYLGLQRHVDLEVIKGTAKRRTPRRGKLRLVS